MLVRKTEQASRGAHHICHRKQQMPQRFFHDVASGLEAGCAEEGKIDTPEAWNLQSSVHASLCPIVRKD